MSWLLSLLASLASEATQQQRSIIHGNHQCAAQQQQLWRTQAAQATVSMAFICSSHLLPIKYSKLDCGDEKNKAKPNF
jgi:hypothetical protein